jgi:hypothetical protein
MDAREDACARTVLASEETDVPGDSGRVIMGLDTVDIVLYHTRKSAAFWNIDDGDSECHVGLSKRIWS